MLSLFKKKKKEDLPVPVRLEIHIYTNEHEIWSQFAELVKGNENENDFVPDVTIPGTLAYELAGLCEREGAFELNAEKIMYFSEVTNYLLLLKKEGDTIGFLLLDLYPGPSPPKIWLVCVSSTEKGKQYSRILIDQAKQMAKDAGKTNIHLEALSRTIGTKVYTPQGFVFNKPTGENMTAKLNDPKKRKTRRQRRRTQRRQQQ